MTDEIEFRVLKFDEYDFGFFSISEEGTHILYTKIMEKFPEAEDKMKIVGGLMSHIRFPNYDALKFWSDNICDFVHEVSESPDKFKFVFDNDGEFVINPNASPHKNKENYFNKRLAISNFLP